MLQLIFVLPIYFDHLVQMVKEEVELFPLVLELLLQLGDLLVYLHILELFQPFILELLSQILDLLRVLNLLQMRCFAQVFDCILVFRDFKLVTFQSVHDLAELFR